jgi:hypothetical protein
MRATDELAALDATRRRRGRAPAALARAEGTARHARVEALGGARGGGPRQGRARRRGCRRRGGCGCCGGGELAGCARSEAQLVRVNLNAHATAAAVAAAASASTAPPAASAEYYVHAFGASAKDLMRESAAAADASFEVKWQRRGPAGARSWAQARAEAAEAARQGITCLSAPQASDYTDIGARAKAHCRQTLAHAAAAAQRGARAGVSRRVQPGRRVRAMANDAKVLVEDDTARARSPNKEL